MESYLISDNEETLVGMQMAGIRGEILTDPEAVLHKIDQLLEDPQIGLIILTQRIKQSIEEEVMIRKMQSRNTLIVEIPGPKDKSQPDFITKYIRESIGLKL
jgi:V/A-type H+-transporting ATPase subunit F